MDKANSSNDPTGIFHVEQRILHGLELNRILITQGIDPIKQENK